MTIETYSQPSALPTVLPSRQRRIEAALTHAIAIATERSTIREAVGDLVDHLRGQDLPVERAVEIVVNVAMRAPFEGKVFKSAVDCRTLVTRWVTQRYSRAD